MKHGEKLYIHVYFKKMFFFCYRYDTIYGTGKIKKSYRRFYRRIRTTQEKRWSIPHEKYVRGKRSKSNLPESWDDYRVSDSEQRGWKRTKKQKQWE